MTMLSSVFVRTMYYELFIPEYKHVEEINLLTWKEYAKNTTVFTIDLPSEIFFK